MIPVHAPDTESVSIRIIVFAIEVGGVNIVLTRHHQKHAGEFPGPTTRGCVPDMEDVLRTIFVDAHQVGGVRSVNTMDHLSSAMTGFTSILLFAVDTVFAWMTMFALVTKVGMELNVVTTHPRLRVGDFRVPILRFALITEFVRMTMSASAMMSGLVTNVKL